MGEILDTLGNPHGQDDEVKKDQQVSVVQVWTSTLYTGSPDTEIPLRVQCLKVVSVLHAFTFNEKFSFTHVSKSSCYPTLGDS